MCRNSSLFRHIALSRLSILHFKILGVRRLVPFLREDKDVDTKVCRTPSIIQLHHDRVRFLTLIQLKQNGFLQLLLQHHGIQAVAGIAAEAIPL